MERSDNGLVWDGMGSKFSDLLSNGIKRSALEQGLFDFGIPAHMGCRWLF